MSIIPLAIFLILLATAIIHAAWGFGMIWPGTDEQSLVNTVIGDPGLTQMPGLSLTLLVAFAIFAAGLCALWGAQLIALPLPEWMRKTSIIILTLIFALRGATTYIPNGPLAQSVEPFKSLDATYFAPLILAIAAGYAYIWFSN